MGARITQKMVKIHNTQSSFSHLFIHFSLTQSLFFLVSLSFPSFVCQYVVLLKFQSSLVFFSFFSYFIAVQFMFLFLFLINIKLCKICLDLFSIPISLLYLYHLLCLSLILPSSFYYASYSVSFFVVLFISVFFIL